MFNLFTYLMFIFINLIYICEMDQEKELKI